METHVLAASQLDGSRHENLRPAGGQLQHLLVADGMELARPGHDARVGREDAVDVRVDLADFGAQGDGQRHRRRVRAAAAERRDVEVGGHALKAGHEHDVADVERLVDAPRPHVDDLRLAVRRVGDDARLRACERDGLVAEVVDGHGRQRARDSLADRDQHVELPRLGAR